MDAVFAGLTLGLGSGISPGPLLALAVAVTLRRGTRSGIAVAFGPVVTDTVIILLAVTVVRQLPSLAVAALSILGAVVVTWFAFENIKAAKSASIPGLHQEVPAPAQEKSKLRNQPLAQAALVNIVNPAPWLFWITAGAPLLISYADRSAPLAIAFLIAFYIAIVGGKALVVIGVGLGRDRISRRVYSMLLLTIGLLLLIVAALLAWSGISTLQGA
jgi:threonine/homoserine/homoserine lactone efflux protein